MGNHVAVVMAAGKGTRMKSELPKVLVEVCGRPMIEYVLDALEAGGVKRSLVVVGYRADLVRQTLAHRRGITFVEQLEQLGTGHAVMMCRQELEGHDGAVMVLAGDSPMVRPQSIQGLLAEFDKERPACILGTAHKENPLGLGRIVRDAKGKFLKIVEEKDASPEERLVTEVNLSCYVFNCTDLLDALARIKPDNAQREYYLTDCPRVLLDAGRDVRALPVLHPSEALSINSVDELALVESAMKSAGGSK